MINKTTKTILERLDTMADQLHRATMVQDRSVHIIKQVCALNAKEARAVRADVAALQKVLKDLLAEPSNDPMDAIDTEDGYALTPKQILWRKARALLY